ncbi:hypothetical protein ACLOJK_037192 [Asimina triloba]
MSFSVPAGCALSFSAPALSSLPTLPLARCQNRFRLAPLFGVSGTGTVLLLCSPSRAASASHLPPFSPCSRLICGEDGNDVESVDHDGEDPFDVHARTEGEDELDIEIDLSAFDTI